MRPTLIPAKISLKSKKHNVIFLWNETWELTDDFFFVWERDQFKPYFRNKIYTLDGKPLHPHYHYDEKTFKEALNDFLISIPLIRVVIQGKATYLICNFGDEYWAFDPVNNQILYTTVTPKRSSVTFKVELVREKLSEFITNRITQRINLAGSHLLHLEILNTRGVKNDAYV